MAQWGVELWMPLGGTIANLPDAKDLQLNLSITDGDTFQFSIDGFDPKAKLINEMFTDVVLYREGVKLYRGRVVSAVQQGDANGATLTVSTVDYKQLLKRRFITAGVIYSGDLEFLAWNAINVTTSASRGSLGITRGTNQSSGTNLARFPVEAGISVYDLIQKLAQTNSSFNNMNAFEWYIDPDLVFRVSVPSRGKRNPTFLADFGGSVLSYDSQFDPNGYANVFYVQGNGSYAATAKTSEGTRTPPGGVFEDYQNDGQLTSVEAVDARAFWMATTNGQLELTKTYNLELSNSRWQGPRSCWIGDFVLLDIQHGAISVKTDQMRVMDMHVSVDPSGYENVAIGVSFAVVSSWKDYNRMSAFMRSTRSNVLRSRANWFNSQKNALYKEYLNAWHRHGKNSYEAKASLKRYNDFRGMQTAYNNKLDFSKKPGKSTRF